MILMMTKVVLMVMVDMIIFSLMIIVLIVLLDTDIKWFDQGHMDGVSLIQICVIPNFRFQTLISSLSFSLQVHQA